MGTNKPIFSELNADDSEATEIESLCMNCHANVRLHMIAMNTLYAS